MNTDVNKGELEKRNKILKGMQKAVVGITGMLSITYTAVCNCTPVLLIGYGHSTPVSTSIDYGGNLLASFSDAVLH